MSNPRDKFITVNGVSLHYLEWGNTDAPSILLVHGLCGNAHYWDIFAHNISNEYHIIALDQRGHGDSDWAESYGPRDYVVDLEAFVDELQLTNFILIGHSMGGINSILYAQRHPNRIRNLIIVDIGPEIGESGSVRMREQILTEPEAFTSFEDVFRYIRSMELFCSDDFIRHQLKHALKQNENSKFVFKYDKSLLQTEMRSPDWLWEYLEGIVCPALVMHGIESDILLSDVAQKMGDILPYGSVMDIELAGHGIVGDNPWAFEEVVYNWLSKHYD